MTNPLPAPGKFYALMAHDGGDGSDKALHGVIDVDKHGGWSTWFVVSMDGQQRGAPTQSLTAASRRYEDIELSGVAR